MIDHIQYNLPPTIDESHATDDTLNPHQSQWTHTYITNQQNSHTQGQIYWWIY